MSNYAATPPIPVLTGKSPETSRPYGHDFSNQLASGDKIATITSVTAQPSDLVLGIPQPVAGELGVGCAVSTLCSGGTAGLIYLVTAVVVTVQGQVLDLSFYLPVLQR